MNPFFIAVKGESRFQKAKGTCSLCSRSIYENINPQKIITCGRCIQILLVASMENKIAFREKLLSEGDREAARSVQSFILPAANDEVGTFKRSLRYGRIKSFYTVQKEQGNG